MELITQHQVTEISYTDFPLTLHFFRFIKCQTNMFRYMPFLVFFSHLSSLLSSSLKRLGSSSFSRISSHCLWYCSRGFAGKEVWSAFTPPSSAPPWRWGNGKHQGESPGLHTEVHARDRWPQVVKTDPDTPVTAIRVTWEPDSNFSSPLPQFPVASIALGSHTVSSRTMSISQVCWEEGVRLTTLHQWVKQRRLFSWQFFSLLLNGSLWIDFQEWIGLKYGHFCNSR